MLTDAELLNGYVRDRSESAFTELVQRHIDLVYSAAVRETGGCAALAEEVSQAVFAELARKALGLCRHPALAGWLYTSVRHFSANLRRAEARRQRRELAAHTMNELLSPDPAEAEWQQIRPVLDDAMHELGDQDRTAVVLRFFQDRSLKEVGQALGLNENAARMRVDRALEKLLGLLAQRGITSTASGLAAGLAAGAVVAAPTGLAASVASGALAGAGAAASTSIGLFEMMKLMSLTKIQLATVGVLIAAAVAAPIWQQTRLQHLAAENTQLREQAVAVPRLRQEVARLRQIELDRAELDRLRQSDQQLQAEVLRLRGRVGVALRSDAENAQLRSEMQKQKQSLEAGKTNQFADAMSDMVKGIVEQQVMGKLGQMKTKLNLTPDQEQAIRELLMKQAEQSSQAAQKLLSGKITKDDFTRLSKSAGDPETQIKALLSPTQLAAYQEYKQEESVSNARLAANAEMLQMQNVVGLSQEQQDKVFPILYDQTLQQLTNAVSLAGQGSTPADVLEKFFDHKLKALGTVLTPAQLESYRQFQATQMKMLKSFVPGDAKAAPASIPIPRQEP